MKPRMTMPEFLTNSKRAINDIETLIHLYPELRILNFTFDDHDGMSVLVAQDTFDKFHKYLTDCCYKRVRGYNDSVRYRSVGRYRHCEIVGYSDKRPTAYPWREEVADDV